MEETARLVARPLTARAPSKWDADAEGSLVAMSLHRAGTAFGIDEWRTYARAWVDAHASPIENSDCGTWGVARVALELNSHQESAPLLSLARNVCESIVTAFPRTEDGLLVSSRDGQHVVADSLYDSSPLLCHAGKILGDQRFTDDAVHQLFGYSSQAHDAVTHLFFHCWDPLRQSSNEVAWARGNGWMINALVDTLEHLSSEHRRRRALQLVLTYLVAALESHQDSEGFWHAIMDDEDSPIETSATALVTAGLARGIVNRSVDMQLRESVLRGWEAVKSRVTSDGRVSDVSDEAECGNADYYISLPTGDYSWGNAAVLFAAAAVKTVSSD